MGDEIQDPTLEHSFKGHRGPVNSACFNRNGGQIASGGKDCNVLIWNLRQPKTARCYKFMGHSESVNCVDYDSNGKLLASVSQDKSLRLWTPMIKGKCTRVVAHSAAVRWVEFSQDGKSLVTASNDKSVKIWYSATGSFVTSFRGHTHWVRCARFAPNGCGGAHVVASCAEDRTVRVWDRRIASGAVHVFRHASGPATCLAWEPRGGAAIAVALAAGSLRVYDLTAGKLRQSYIVHNEQPVTGVDWHPQGAYVLSAGIDGTLVLLDVMEGRPLYTLKAHKPNTDLSVRFNSDGSYFASAGGDSTVMVWKCNFSKACTESLDSQSELL